MLSILTESILLISFLLIHRLITCERQIHPFPLSQGGNSEDTAARIHGFPSEFLIHLELDGITKKTYYEHLNVDTQTQSHFINGVIFTYSI
jgi:hypothetical protein